MLVGCLVGFASVGLFYNSVAMLLVFIAWFLLIRLLFEFVGVGLFSCLLVCLHIY